MKVTLRLSNGRALVSVDGPVESLRFLSVCSGIEAASLAWQSLGWRAIGFAEIEKFPSAVLAHHYPNVPNYGDFTRINTSRLGRVDILCGGTPCQAFSVAGARRSLDDARGNLTLAFVDLAHDLARNNRLRNAVWENVPGVLSTKDNAFGCFLAGLVGADEPLVPVEPYPAPGKSNKRYGWSAKDKRHYVKWPRAGVVIGPKGRAAWTVKDAQYFGLAQRRERVIVVADFGIGADPAAVLFEPESMRRDSPPSRETGQGIASGFEVGPSGGSWTDVAPTLDCRAKNGPVQNQIDVGVLHAPEIARCDATREGSSQDYETTTMLACVGVAGPISHALKAEGADASEDGTGRRTPIICFDTTQITSAANRSNPQPGDPCHPLAAGAHPPAITVALRGREGGGTAELGDDVSFALRASSGGGDKPHVLTGTPVYPINEVDSGWNSNGLGIGADGEPSPTLQAGKVHGVSYASAVRRLTPRECERLQGFQFLVSPSYPGAWRDEAGRWWSPDYTAIPVKKVSVKNQEKARRDTSEMFVEIDGEMWTMAADGPRYRGLGNSWAVPKFRWLGERIQKFMPA